MIDRRRQTPVSRRGRRPHRTACRQRERIRYWRVLLERTPTLSSRRRERRAGIPTRRLASRAFWEQCFAPDWTNFASDARCRHRRWREQQDPYSIVVAVAI